MACNGDSGGPLVCMRGNQPFVYGITSWAIPGCSYADTAPLFARVGHFRDWINEKAQEFFNRQPYPVDEDGCVIGADRESAPVTENESSGDGRSFDGSGDREESTCPDVDECPLGPPGWGETGGSYTCDSNDNCEYFCEDGGATGIITKCRNGRWSDPDMAKVRRSNCHVCDPDNMPWSYSPSGYFVGADGPGSWDCSWSANRVLFCDASCASRDVDLVIACNRNVGTGNWFKVSGDDEAHCHPITTLPPTTSTYVPDDNGFCDLEIPQWENFLGGDWVCDRDNASENTKCDWICPDGMQIKNVTLS